MKDKTSVLVYLLAGAFVLTLVGRMMMGREGFGLQTVAMPEGGGDGLYNGVDATGMWADQPGLAPLKPYDAANDNQLFMYQESTFSGECCPGAISNDAGCLCPSAHEKREWLTRGGNRIPM